MNTGIFLLLGSNMGNSRDLLLLALQQISIHIGQIVHRSCIYKTAAWGNSAQPDFLNMVVEVQFNQGPQALLKRTMDIERAMGRKREEKWGPRTIDIDILFYGTEIIETESLTVPHPRIEQRMFALAPLAEIRPDFVHPRLHMSISELKANCRDTLPVERTDL